MIISPDFTEQINIPAGKLGETILAYQRDKQTGLVDLDFPGQASRILLFARGQLVSVYSDGTAVERLDPAAWVDSLHGSSQVAALRTLTLTAQDVRIFKILIEQMDAVQGIPADRSELEKLFAAWVQHPVPGLAQVRWPRAEALIMFPGQSAGPLYSLFITMDKILNSAGDLKRIYGWKEKVSSVRLLSSETRTLAWTEYLLHHAFSSLVSSLFGKFEKLIGRLTLNQIIRDVNFKATAQDWSLSINAASVNDQTIFASPAAAAEMYSSLLEVILQSFESVVGHAMLEMMVREAVYRLPVPAREVVKEYLPVMDLGSRAKPE